MSEEQDKKPKIVKKFVDNDYNVDEDTIFMKVSYRLIKADDGKDLFSLGFLCDEGVRKAIKEDEDFRYMVTHGFKTFIDTIIGVQ